MMTWLHELDVWEPRKKVTHQQSLQQRRIREHNYRRKGLASTPQTRARWTANHYKKWLKGDRCELCGSTTQLEMHHPNYSEPSEVNTLCSNCHKQVHNLNLILTQYLNT